MGGEGREAQEGKRREIEGGEEEDCTERSRVVDCMLAGKS